MKAEKDIRKISKPQRLKIFRDYVFKYLKKLGIQNFEIYCTTDTENTDCRAYVNTGEEKDRIVNFYLCNPMLTCSDSIFKDEVKRAAFHEVCEVLCQDAFGYKMDLFYAARESQIASHKIIRMMENVFFDNSPKDDR